MKRVILLVSAALLLTGCQTNDNSSVADEAGTVAFQSTTLETTASAAEQEPDSSTEMISETEDSKEINEAQLKIEVNGHTLTAKLADNTAAQKLAEMLKEAPLTLELNEYGSFEKVGALPHSLPTDDRRITTEPGDIMLYQGDKITIYYATNTWSFTPLGKIENTGAG